MTEARDLFPCGRPDHFPDDFLTCQALQADIVLFVKNGCGHCAKAKEATTHLPSQAVFLLDTVASRRNLAKKLRLPVVTVPVVFIRGRCVGDGEALRTILADKIAFEHRMSFEFPLDPFAVGVPDVSAWTKLRLCHPPGGGVASYFLNTYGNVVRAMSLVHVCLFVLGLVVPIDVCTVGASFLALDLILFIVSGNLSPIALASTALLWRRRGPVVPAIPYKVVFIFYLVALSRVIVRAASITELRSALIGGITNSAMLAALRF
mmetsp:Transcript_46370/g.63134  ORF Transcript_46370/g.63134 Transcript_46370/m.63134 type:complete len:263 (-) Transcript_46370:429-1217(-)